MNDCVKVDESGFYITDYCCDGEYVPPYKCGATKCKHKSGECDKCGTTLYNDRIHTTKNGKGLVARIRK